METNPFLLFVIAGIDIKFYPVTPGILIALICIIILLVCSALISGTEVAFFSLSPSDKSILERKNNRKSQLVLKTLRHPERLLATILITNNFVNIGIVIIAAFSINSLMDLGNVPVLEFLIQVIIVTFFLLLFGEILPKLYANQHVIPFALFMAYPIRALEKVFYPFSSFLIYSTSVVRKRLEKKKQNISMDDLSEALELTSEEIAEEKNILESIIESGNINVSEIMTSRTDISAIGINTKLKDLVSSVTRFGYSRVPVYEDNVDNIKGILYIKDLLPHLHKSDRFNWQSLIRPPYYVPENKKINDLLREFQTKKIHMAIVVDEYGGTSGIITFEDIIEEIVGEIIDESDENEVMFQRLDNNSYIFDGKILLKDFFRITDLPGDFFDDIRGDADTLAGLILEQKGEIPVTGEQIILKDIIFSIESVDKRRIKQIKVTLRQNK